MSALATNPPRSDPSDRLTVGVADLVVTDKPDATIVTYALGSCLGATIYDPVARIGGLLHFMLPTSEFNKEKGEANPAMFGDVGIPLLFRRCLDLGGRRERLIVCAAGGAEVLSDDGHFRIGSRNRTVLRKLLWKNGILLSGDDTGGSNSRTMSLRLSDGRVVVRSQGTEHVLWPI